MLKIFKKQKGFTLIEMMVAMGIFVMFIGILISSYTDIVRSNTEANDYRILYSEARRVFDTLSEEIRKGSVEYLSNASINAPFTDPKYNTSNDSLVLISENGGRKVTFSYEEEADEGDISKGNIVFTEEIIDTFSGNPPVNSYPLLSSGDVSRQVYLTEFSVFVSPVGDPYNPNNVYSDGLQFQPKVTIFATFEMKKRKGEGVFNFDLQTTVSSRSYSQGLIFNLTGENL